MQANPRSKWRLFSTSVQKKVLIIDGVSENGTPNYGNIKYVAPIRRVAPDYIPKYDKYVVFAKYIQNVRFTEKCSTKATLQRLEKYYAKSDVASIKQLHFDGWTLQKSHGRLLAKLVKNVESVTFSRTRVVDNLYEGALKYMKNMKELTIADGFFEIQKKKNAWMLQKYPKLERFVWYSKHMDLPIAKTKKFFIINPNIKFFSLFTTSNTIVEKIIAENIQVNELDFEIDQWRKDQHSLLTKLWTFCETQSCRLNVRL